MNFLAGLERETSGLLSAAYRWLLRSISRSERVLAVLKTTVNVKALPRTRERNTEWSPQICDILCVLTCSGGAGSGQGGFKKQKCCSGSCVSQVQPRNRHLTSASMKCQRVAKKKKKKRSIFLTRPIHLIRVIYWPR